MASIGEDHLLVDDEETAHRANVVRRIHPGQKLAQPVLTATEPWEHDGADRRVYIYGTVLRDGDLFRMWYMRYPDRLPATRPIRLRFDITNGHLFSYRFIQNSRRPEFMAPIHISHFCPACMKERPNAFRRR